MYQTILVPLDRSPRAALIMPHATSLARVYGARVVLLSVIDPNQLLPDRVSVEEAQAGVTPEMLRKLAREALDYLEAQQKKLQAEGIETVIEVRSGPVVQAICQVAEEYGADLVAIASHGRTGLAHAYYGSVAAGIMHQLQRPLLLVRARFDSEAAA